MACASSAAAGHVGGTSAMPSRYRSNGSVMTSDNVPSSALFTDSAPGYRARHRAVCACLQFDCVGGYAAWTRNAPASDGRNETRVPDNAGTLGVGSVGLALGGRSLGATGLEVPGSPPLVQADDTANTSRKATAAARTPVMLFGGRRSQEIVRAKEVLGHGRHVLPVEHDLADERGDVVGGQRRTHTVEQLPHVVGEYRRADDRRDVLGVLQVLVVGQRHEPVRLDARVGREQQADLHVIVLER